MNDVPAEVELDETDVLRVENISLKIQTAQQQVSLLSAERDRFVSSLNGKYGVDDISKYQLDPKTMKATRQG